MQKMSGKIENIVNAYKTLSKIPSIVSGRLNKAGDRITAKWSVRNLDRGKTTKYLYNYILDDKLNVIAESEFGVDVSNELLSAVSPTESCRAVIREEPSGKDSSKKQYLEVWRANCLAHSIDLTALDLHGDVYADSEFGSLDWSPDESALVYVAERKPLKCEPYIKRQASAPGDGGGETTAARKGEEHLYRQDWGEQLVGKRQSVIAVCRLHTETVSILDGLPETWCPGQVRFTLDGAAVYGVAWLTEPRRLGLIYCTNRPSYIFTLTMDGIYKRVSPEGMSVRSPRAQGKRLVWLQRLSAGPHHAAHELVSYSEKEGYAVIIGIVDEELQTSNHKSFRGVYSQALPARCFSEDGRRIVLSTPQQCDVRAYCVDNHGIDGGRLVQLNAPDAAGGSVTVLDVSGDVILAAFSSVTTPPQLYVCKLPPVGSEAELEWRRVSSPALDTPPALAAAAVHPLRLEHPHTSDSVRSFSALYVSPRVDAGARVPLVVWPHGGPHSNFVDAYSLEAALFTVLGFACLQINYRGSSGAGQDSVEFLPKRVGVADVRDCKYATEEALKRFPTVDGSKLCLFGGSHGGFLVTHLSGQYPEMYRAVATRNPVTDIATMNNYSDIPDWCAVEAGFEFTEQGPVSEEQLLAMRRCSPLVHVHKVKAPTALMLGAVDKRVPYYQGLEYCRRLKANGVPTRVYMYDDNHTLSSLPVEMDCLINSAAWLMEHIAD